MKNNLNNEPQEKIDSKSMLRVAKEKEQQKFLVLFENMKHPHIFYEVYQSLKKDYPNLSQEEFHNKATQGAYAPLVNIELAKHNSETSVKNVSLNTNLLDKISSDFDKKETSSNKLSF